ncbi:hypothetical protein [Acinetobacter johnsonii]|uniref:Uncharacterized protein n=1 Tax=Acinetobacter johnsonii TaxID=40214 RepID=A0A376BDH8_ACIJO|nr:hypothetical protein [Acinetobacter johnsonii]ENU39258.1 hypothetical protein F986_02041 [Acinetobacter johnsonii CIP 64.6]QPS04808.1 hypothetical protein I6G67_04935 [Acinetobacter johnsonii]SSX66191.1 Uncharacterised protein [Acinetobacter johnsonii]SUT95568.1 Uncharacterised protein [Acinetobacter johnsonii]
MEIKELKAEFEKLKYIEEKLEYLNFDEHLGCYVEKNNGMPVGLAAWVNGAFYGFEQAVKAQAVPEGFVLIKDDTKTVVAIERMVEQQVEASGMDSRRLERLDGWKIIEAAVKAQESQITELKVEWASDCFKCGHHEAIIYSTAAEASTKGWFHDGDEVKCTGCGNTGEMDARGEDSDICWNEDEAND